MVGFHTGALELSALASSSLLSDINDTYAVKMDVATSSDAAAEPGEAAATRRRSKGASFDSPRAARLSFDDLATIDAAAPVSPRGGADDGGAPRLASMGSPVIGLEVSVKKRRSGTVRDDEGGESLAGSLAGSLASEGDGRPPDDKPRVENDPAMVVTSPIVTPPPEPARAATASPPPAPRTLALKLPLAESAAAPADAKGAARGRSLQPNPVAPTSPNKRERPSPREARGRRAGGSGAARGVFGPNGIPRSARLTPGVPLGSNGSNGVDLVSANSSTAAPVAVWKSTSGMDASSKTSNLSISAKSKSIRLVFGRIDRSRRVLEAQPKSSCRNCRIRAH